MLMRPLGGLREEFVFFAAALLGMAAYVVAVAGLRRNLPLGSFARGRR
jgi:hypothetical protein